MEDCKKCVEGIVSQGESIKKVCADCGGTGKIGETVKENPPVAEEVKQEESFLGGSSEVSVDSSEGE